MVRDMADHSRDRYSEGRMPMTPARLRPNPWIIVVPPVLILLLWIAAVLWPAGEVRWILLAVAFCVAVILAIVCIFTFYSRLSTSEDLVTAATAATTATRAEVLVQRSELADLRTRFAQHLTLCEAGAMGPDLDVELREMTRPKSA